MPVVASGRVGAMPKGPRLAGLPLDPAKRYFVSVLPDGGGYQMGGAPLAAGQTSVTIVVNKTPFPRHRFRSSSSTTTSRSTARPTCRRKLGLAGFSIMLKEAGGTYGQSGGQVTQDAFGNPIGTTYQQAANGNFIFEADGVTPKVLTLGSGFIASGPTAWRASRTWLPPSTPSRWFRPPAPTGTRPPPSKAPRASTPG